MSTEHTLTQLRQIIQGIDCGESQYKVLERIANQMQSDLKRYEDSCKLQETGKSAYESIAEMVAALECDYDRLEELRGHRDTLREEFDSLPANAGVDFANWIRNQDLMTSEDVDELAELEAAAGDCADREEAEQRIHEDPLSVEVCSGWYSYGDTPPAPEKFTILLGTGGPATRIMGELNEHGEPTRAWIQAQDWFQPWTDYVGGDSDTLLTYARCFYFGEG